MPSPRRMRLLMIAAVCTFVLFLFYSSGINDSGEAAARTGGGDFYSKTKAAMEGQAVLDSQTGQKAGHIPADKDADGDVDEDDQKMAQQMQERLKAAEQEAKDKANEKALRPDPPSNVIGVGSSAEGNKDKAKADAVAGTKGDAASSNDKKKMVETKEQMQAEAELTSILKKSPVIIFSKSYCPFSKRAKGLLLEKYRISPEPHVVELDEHPLGAFLQDVLLEKTGRRTVPNIMINGISIGGADDIIAMDKDDKLVAKIVELGNKRVDMTERFVQGDSAH